MTRVIAFISGKGGVGKTTTTVNVASALQLFGREVILVDGNLTAPHIGLYLGVPLSNPTIHDAFNNKKKINEVTFIHNTGLKVVPATISFEEMKKTDFKKFKSVIDGIRKYAEILIIDCPAGFGEETKAVIGAVDSIIVVTNPEASAVCDALKCVKMCDEMKTKVLGVVINKTRDDGFDMPNESVKAILEHDIIATIPLDENIRRSVSLRTPVIHSNPNTPAADAFKQVAVFLVGEKNKNPPRK